MTDDSAGSGELGAVARLARTFPAAPKGQTWIGDDCAVVGGGLLLAIDSAVAGVHQPADLGASELGYRAVVRNVSDIAAMGGSPKHLLVAVVGGDDGGVDEVMAGVAEAANEYGCVVVGGDVSAGPGLTVTVAITGSCDGEPVLRSGARPGDMVWVTGPLGGAAASGYRLRPVARVADGESARRAGATAMIDVSDGLFLDCRRLATASGVGLEVDTAAVPVADGATLAQALGGGDDYQLVYTLPPDATGPGVVIGRCTDDPTQLPPATGWTH